MIYELRTYTLKQGSVPDVVKAASTVSRSIRGDEYGKLEGYWTTEIGPLIRPNLVRQDIRLLNAVREPVAPAQKPNVYELRCYRARPGGAKQWLDLFTRALPAREKYSRIVGLWATEAGQPNEVCHVWAYADLNARTAARAAVAKDPAWQDFLKSSTGLLDEMHSTIMLPAPHSPLQ